MYEAEYQYMAKFFIIDANILFLKLYFAFDDNIVILTEAILD